jgi:hypothetical protein
VILAASLGTLFEWYDFFLYGSLAVFFGRLFFPKGDHTAQLLIERYLLQQRKPNTSAPSPRGLSK